MTNHWAKMIDVSILTAMLLACFGAVQLTGWSVTVAVVVLAFGFYSLVYRLQSRLDTCRRDKEQLHGDLARAWRPVPAEEEHAQRTAEAPLGALEARTSTAVLESHERQLLGLSQALHEDVAQILAGLRLDLELHRCEATALGSYTPSPGLESAISHVDHGIARIRHLVRTIRPSDLDDWGLVAALRPLTAAFHDRTGLVVELAVPSGMAEELLDARATTQGYRVVQEALDNIERHASATRVLVGVRERAEDLTLEIVDDGCGFDVSNQRAAGQCGLDVMKARARMASGNLWILSSPGNGTRVLLRLPRHGPARVAAGMTTRSRTGRHPAMCADPILNSAVRRVAP